MRILHLLSSAEGGAARAALRLHEGLLRDGVSSLVRLLHPAGEFEAVRDFRRKGPRWAWLRLRETLTPALGATGQERFSRARTPYRVPVAGVDLVHLHEVAGFVDYGTFFASLPVPVVLTLHDMNPFTGGCHYSAGCRGFAEACRPCPQLAGSYPGRALALKARALAGRPMRVVAPSRWMGDLAAASRALGAYRPIHIPYGVDERVFRPRPRPENPLPVLLFVAHYVDSPRKGLRDLAAAAGDRRDLVVWVVGRRDGTLSLPSAFQWLGPAADDESLARLYAAADATVVFSREDNLPNTALESLLCGTPVLARPVGGLAEIVQDGTNGVLAENPIDRFLVGKWDRGRIAAAARERYALGEASQAYRRLYAELLGSRVPS